MSLSKEVIVDQMEIKGNGVIQVREKVLIKEDGVTISQSFHRRMVMPGDNILNEPTNLKAIAEVVHTPEVVSAFLTSLGE